MKAIILYLLTNIFIIHFASAQIDLLQLPTETEKKEILKVVTSYQNFINTMSIKDHEEEKKNISIKFLKENLSGANVSVYNDLDSLAKSDDFLAIFKYTQKLPESYYGTLTTFINLNKIANSKIKYDKVRKYYFIESTVDKLLRWYELKEHINTNDTLININKSSTIDSIIIQDTIVSYDTLRHSMVKKLTFFIRFDKENNVYKNFKLFALSKVGTAPKLEPLPPLVSWWLTLDDEWRNIFRKKLNLEEYPRAYDVEKLTGTFELDCSSTSISNLSPLEKFTDLRILNCSNTVINSITPISKLTYLKELNLSKTNVKDLQGIENLKRLEKLYCSGIKLADINPIQGLTSLIELDCSENEIEDISIIKNLINLEELNISLNIKIKDIAALSDLVKLTKLSIRKIDIRNLDYIKKLENLVYLDCYNTNITSLEPIRNLKKVIHLSLDHNKITSLEPIKNYQFIVHLSLASSSITDLSDIKNYYNIRELDISNIPTITTLGPVHKYEYIKVLKCINTGINKNEIARFKKNHLNCQITYY